MTPPIPASRFRLLSVADLLIQPDLEYVIEGLIPRGAIVMLYGKSGDGKSFVALDWALHVAAAGEDATWFGRAITSGPVVYVVAEGQAGFKSRVGAWLAAQRTTDVAHIRFVYEAAQLLDLADVSAFTTTVRSWNPTPALVIFDSFHANSPGAEENSAKDTGLIVNNLNHLRRETGAASVLIHHPMKHSDMERGSSSLKAAMDVVLKLQKDDNVITISSTKVKDGPPLERFRVQLTGQDDSQIITAATSEPAGALTKKHMGALKSLYDIDDGEGCSDASWCQNHCDTNHVSRSTFLRLKKYLKDEECVSLKKKHYQLTEKGLAAIGVRCQTGVTQVPLELGQPIGVSLSPSLGGGRHDTKTRHRRLKPSGTPGACAKHPDSVERAPSGELACRICRPELFPEPEPAA